MSSEVVLAEASHTPAEIDAALEAEKAAEKHLVRSLIKGIVISIPICMVIFLCITAAAISDKTEWYVWVGLGCGLGVIGGSLFGVLASVTLNAEKFDTVDGEAHEG